MTQASNPSSAISSLPVTRLAVYGKPGSNDSPHAMCEGPCMQTRQLLYAKHCGDMRDNNLDSSIIAGPTNHQFLKLSMVTGTVMGTFHSGARRFHMRNALERSSSSGSAASSHRCTSATCSELSASIAAFVESACRRCIELLARGVLTCGHSLETAAGACAGAALISPGALKLSGSPECTRGLSSPASRRSASMSPWGNEMSIST